MPYEYEPEDEFTLPFNLMADADPADGDSARAPLEVLANRTRFLHERLNNAVGEYTYHEGVRSRSIKFGPEEGFPSAASSGVLDFYPNLDASVPVLVPRVDAGFVTFRVPLPPASVINQVRVLTRASASRTETNRWGVRAFTRALNFALAEAPTATQRGSTTYADAGTGYKLISLSSLAYTVTGNDSFYVTVLGPTGSLASTDQLLGVYVAFSDVGPRNDR